VSTEAGPRPESAPAPTATDALLAAVDADLAAADADLAARYPGPSGRRQPVHTYYVPVDRVHAGTVAEAGRIALDLVDEHLPDPVALAELLGGPELAVDGSPLMDAELAGQVHPLLRDKLRTEPVEDLRIDLEDGFTQRGVAAGDRDDDEDGQVQRVLAELAAAETFRGLPPFWGLRFKSLDPATRHRGIRTFAAVARGLVEADLLPDRFHPTLPKVTSADQVRAMVRVCEALESDLGLPAGRLRFEIQVETPQSICGPEGENLVAPLVHASGGRCLALHYGTYDYSAFCGIAAEYQAMDHPVADHAKAVMQVAAAGTGVFLSDGSTNRLPVGSPEQIRQGWRLHARLVDRSLRRGYYQGWDLHPAQLVTRYAATFAFYRRSLPTACERLRVYTALAAGEQVDSVWLDEPATARALADFCLRALRCGALTAGELAERAGLDPAELSVLAGETPTEGDAP